MKTKIKSFLIAAVLTAASVVPFASNATAGIPDPDGDGSITISDVVTISMYLAGNHCPTNPDAYDTDRNGIISAMDAKCVEMYLAQIWNGNGTGSSSSVEDSNTYRSYSVYDAANGNFMRNYTLSPLESKNNTRGIIGTDDRVIDWTKSGTVKLMTSSNYAGTGFVVGSHTIATAAHCVYNYSSSKGKSLTEILLFDSNGNISLHATPVEMHVPNIYINLLSSTSGTNQYDYALITVEEDLSDYACYNLGSTMDSIFTNNQAISVTGFPQQINKGSTNVQNVNDHTNHYMYTGTGSILNKHPFGNYEQLFYDVDVTEGKSGGPVYATESRNGNTYFTVLAINAAVGYEWNIGTRINTDIIHFYKNNSNLNW